MIAFEHLETYKRAMGFANSIYLHSRQFPVSEIYGLTSQIRRAAVSVAANIAEGSGRRSQANQIMFYLNARGSLYECIPLLDIAHAQGFIEQTVLFRLKREIYEIAALLNGLIRYLKTNKNLNFKTSPQKH